VRLLLPIVFLVSRCAAQQPTFVVIPVGPVPPFSMVRTEVTFGQFTAFVKATGYRTTAERASAARTWRAPGFKTERDQPVVYVTVDDATAYCESIGARLPTDAEWEYAARAGATTLHYWGDTIDGRYLWYRANSDGRPQPVARKLPNAWGLFDVEGNVWEWALSADRGEPLANRRGGSWVDCAVIDGGPGRRTGPLIGLSKYYKIPIKFQHRYDDIGFRCAK
jgi:formylglycine-generating enzyme required for sulfatase activity